jgi:putative sugar O-methyltransferase
VTVLYAIDDTTDIEHAICTIARLAERGADVRVMVDAPDASVASQVRTRCAAMPRVQCEPAPLVSPTALSYLAEYLLQGSSTWARRPVMGPLLRWSERSIPTAAAADDWLANARPDVLLTPPLVSRGSLRADLVRSARALGIACVIHADPNPANQSHADAAAIAALVEGQAGSGTRQPAPGMLARLARPVFARVAARAAATPEGQRARERRVARLRHSRDLAAQARKAGLATAKQQAGEVRIRLRREQAARLDAVRAERLAAQAAAEARRAEAVVIARRTFVEVREWAERMNAGGPIELSAHERRIAADLQPLWTMPLDAVATLRHWGAAITGTRVEDSVELDDPPREHLEREYRARREFYARQKDIGRALMVAESDILGGFGWLRNGLRYNADTLRFMHGIGALNDGALLDGFRRPARRQVVWEIGGGWGGFAYQFKTLCPDVTYVITGLPEMLLVSATYLAAAFPGARCVRFEPGGADPWTRLDDADFVFAPEQAIDELRPPRLDLMLDVGAIYQMTADRISHHVRRGFEAGARYWYSMLPAGAATAETAAVRTEITRYFWPHPIPPRPVGTLRQQRGEGRPQYRHLAGWRRIRV